MSVINKDLSNQDFDDFREVDTRTFMFDRFYDLNILDDAIRKYAHKVFKPNDPCLKVICSEKNYQKLLKMSSRDDQDEHEAVLTLKTKQKWLSPQGGDFTQEQIEEVSLPYYISDEHKECVLDDFMRHLFDYIIRWHIRYNFPSVREAIITDARELWNCYKADHRSIAGMTARGDRRIKSTRVLAIRQALTDPTYIDPVIGGMRNKDGKLRGIFIDSLANYFREVRVFYRIFRWWTNHASDMHQSDYELAKEICQCAPKSSYNADYKGMDWHIRPSAAHITIDLYCFSANVPAIQRSEMHVIIDEMASVPLICGNKTRLGYHSWFSGLYPTHDLEGFQNFSILNFSFHLCGFEVVPYPRKLKSNQVFIKVCGDDSTVLIGRKLTPQEREQISLTHVQVAERFGQIMEMSKVDYSESHSVFCKKTFALRQNTSGFKHYSDKEQTPIHKFPLNKAIHVLYEPENIPPFSDPTDLVRWTCSVMDNAYGMRDYKSVVIYLYQQNRALFQSVDYNNYDISETCELFLQSDWFFRNYVSFSLENSPTWQLLAYCKEKNL